MSDLPNFFQWCKDRNLNPYLDEDTDEKGEMKAESNAVKRAGIRSHAYPPLYSRGQYPPEYFRPIAADAPVYQELDGEKPRK